MPASKRIVLICTGLGRVNRGFEQYIASLAARLSNEPTLNSSVEVWSGASIPDAAYSHQRIWSINRSWLDNLGLKHGFLWELRSFLVGMLGRLISKPPAVIYLGEYQLYCYLFKIRKLFRLNFSLILYTGGQAIPGATVFDNRRDYVHHVTDVYLPACTHIPADRQVLLPHFINDDFVYDQALQNRLRAMAAGRKLLLTVGLLDKQVKRMDLLIESLNGIQEQVFPMFIGAVSKETPALRERLLELFGPEGFLMEEVPHKLLGNYYAVADLFVSCSPKESFGLAMVEALWHGVPVVCADFTESKWVLGQHASFVKSNVVTEWAAAISNEWMQPRNQHTAEERKRFAKNRYGWDALRPAYLNMFEQAVSR